MSVRSYAEIRFDGIDENMVIQYDRIPAGFRSEQDKSLLDLVVTKYPDSAIELESTSNGTVQPCNAFFKKVNLKDASNYRLANFTLIVCRWQ